MFRARSLQAMPVTQAVFVDGELGVPVVDMLVNARKRLPEVFGG